MTRVCWGLVAALLLIVTACAHGGAASQAQPSEQPSEQPGDSPVRVEVTNNHALPMEVDAVGAGTTQRLGTVHPGMAGHFTVPPALIGSGAVEFQAHPSASGEMFTSGPLLLKPGAVVDFVISAQLFSSTATIRQ